MISKRYYDIIERIADMKELDYNELTGEIADHLEKSINIVLATCADGIVTG